MRGLIRLAGPKAFEILEQITASRDVRQSPKRQRGSARSGDPTLAHASGSDEAPDRVLTKARLRDPGLPVLVARFPGPGTYTGDDVAELQLPGNPALLDRVVRACVRHGARLAEPGEFTFRAFLAGRMDLTRAEGVAATIAATSDSQLAAAHLLRQGRLGSFATDLVDRLGQLLALVEAGIDFTDQEDVVPITPRELDNGMKEVETDLRRLLERSRSWGTLEALPRVVLVGPPSSGKSTLFNALLGHDRAVIHDQPGTTRDVLEEPLELTCPGGRRVEVMLVDIAGLDDAEALLDRAAQHAADAAIARADLLLLIRAADDPEPRTHTRGRPTNTPAIPVLTKTDLLSAKEADPDALPVSAPTGQGLERLRKSIAKRVGERGVSLAGDMLALQPRHETALRDALTGLDVARERLAPQRDAAALDGVEWVAAALRDALDALASLGGELTPDDIIGRVFATFCVGK